MPLDVLTLFVVAVCLAALLGLFLFFTWIQDRKIEALAWWGSAYLLGGLGVGLRVLETAAASLSVPFGLPSAVLFVACGMVWNGARLFQGQRSRPLATAAGGIAWFVACQFPIFAQSTGNRIILSSVILSAYAFLTARELWRERRNRRRARWAAVFVPLLHAVVFLPPIALTLMQGAPLSDSWMAAFTLEMLVYSVGTAFIVLVMTKERAERMHKTAAATDTLTGVLNRRGFLEKTQALIARRPLRSKRVTALMFDLDHFKSINDRFGHAAGDEALRVFAQTISTTMREGDIIGRLGGEEFAALLPGAARDAGVAAERVRAAFERVGVEIGGHRMNATVSIGAADADARDCNIERLLARADAALYAAKEGGRNRVAFAADEMLPSPPAPGDAPKDLTARPILPPLGVAASGA
ncbi:MAG TPA: GGDEF domain-containing protein [Xanthobacteraceae bacterium]|nr:GGDEF domain-containing protein [Xanthobacteraceae bacterium]